MTSNLRHLLPHRNEKIFPHTKIKSREAVLSFDLEGQPLVGPFLVGSLKIITSLTKHACAG